MARETGNPHTRALVELVFSNPYTKIDFVVNAGIAKRETASKYLKKIEMTGLLRGVKRGRETYYVNEPLMRVLSG